MPISTFQEPRPPQTQQRASSGSATASTARTACSACPSRRPAPTAATRAEMKLGGARPTDLKQCVRDLRRERQRIRLDADDTHALAVCHQGDRRDVRLMWSVSPPLRPARAYVGGEVLADELHEVVRWCSYRSRALGLRRIPALPVWLVVGKMESSKEWRGVDLDDVRYSEGQPRGPSLEWRLDALKRLFSPDSRVKRKGVAISFDGPQW
jgi:hypothetical protein